MKTIKITIRLVVIAAMSLALMHNQSFGQFADITLSQRVIYDTDSPFNVSAQNSITASSATAGDYFIITSGATVNLSAGNIIRLKPGFHARAGSRFRAKIDASLRSDAFADQTLSMSMNDATTESLKRIPTEFALAQNYPNPFNPATTIQYALKEASLVRLEVFDMLGRAVGILVNQQQAAGSYAVNFNATQLASGVYLYRLRAGNFVETRKMILAK